MKTFTVIAMAASLLLTGCATGMLRMHDGETLSYVDYAGAPIDRFSSFHLDGWEAIGRDQLVVWADMNHAYLLKVWNTCPNLQFANRIAVTSTVNVFSRLEAVRVGHERCPISEIRPIDLQHMKADRAAAKAAK